MRFFRAILYSLIITLGIFLFISGIALCLVAVFSLDLKIIILGILSGAIGFTIINLSIPYVSQSKQSTSQGEQDEN